MRMMRFECRVCGEEKSSPRDFYPQQLRRDGIGECKDCTRARVSRRRLEKIDEIRAYDRERGRLPYRKEANARRQRENADTHALHTRAWRARNQEKYKAHIALNNAIRDGLAKKPSSCERCGSQCLIHGHHDDYSKPLEVRWLCSECHGAEHREVNERIRAMRFA